MNKKKNSNNFSGWFAFILLGFCFGFLMGSMYGFNFSDKLNDDLIEDYKNIISDMSNSYYSDNDVYTCEQECKDWFGVFVGDSSQLSCGDMWYTDCFKYCYGVIEGDDDE